MKIKKSLLGLLTGIMITSCAINPKGHFDIAYVPIRVDDQVIRNEVMTELNLETEIKNTGIIIGGAQRTFAFPFYNKTPSFIPNRQEYDIYTKIKRGNFEYYIKHMCSHQVDNGLNKRFFFYDEETEKRYILGFDKITKIGIRFNF